MINQCGDLIGDSLALVFAGMDVSPGDYVFADEDGIVVSGRDLSRFVDVKK